MKTLQRVLKAPLFCNCFENNSLGLGVSYHLFASQNLFSDIPVVDPIVRGSC